MGTSDALFSLNDTQQGGGIAFASYLGSVCRYGWHVASWTHKKRTKIVGADCHHNTFVVSLIINGKFIFETLSITSQTNLFLITLAGTPV
jgi:hypothetical protein